MAVRKYQAHIDLQQNELQNAVVQNLATAPNNLKKGQEYFNTTDNTKYIWNGSAWVSETTQGKTYTAGTGISISAGDEISVTDPVLTNRTSSTYGMSIGGIENIGTWSICINTDYETSGAYGNSSVQIGGYGDANTAGTAVGCGAEAYGESSTAYGNSAVASSDNSTAIGSNSQVGENADYAIQLGEGYNEEANSFYVGLSSSNNYKLLGSDGKIPNARLNLDGTPTSASTNGITSGAVYTALGDYVPTSTKGQANGVASLDSTGKVPTAQLPSFVDDVIDSYIVSGATALSAGWLSVTDGGTALTPETGKIYVVLSTGEYLNKTYRWSGSTYVEISASPAQATESAAGIAQIATQAEVNTGTNDTDFVTPLKLATYIGNKKATFTNPALTASGGQVTWTISTTLAPDCIISVRETSTGAEVYTDVTYGSGIITVKMNSGDVSAGVYTAVVLG